MKVIKICKQKQREGGIRKSNRRDEFDESTLYKYGNITIKPF
jgi:hypothetical protein